MIDIVKAEETANVREEAREACRNKKAAMNREYGKKADGSWDTFGFRSGPNKPLEMTQITTEHFEGMIRTIMIMENHICQLEDDKRKIRRIIDDVARGYAKDGRPLPTWNDLYQVAEAIGWKEPKDVTEMIMAYKITKEAEDNAEA